MPVDAEGESFIRKIPDRSMTVNKCKKRLTTDFDRNNQNN